MTTDCECYTEKGRRSRTSGPASSARRLGRRRVWTVQPAHLLTVQDRGHADHLGERDHAGAPDAHEPYGGLLLGHHPLRFGYPRRRSGRLPPAALSSGHHGDEGGEVRAYCLGLGVDPLTFAADLLTAVVNDARVFDELFGKIVSDNAEGRVLDAQPFTAESIERLTAEHPFQAAGAALLKLAAQSDLV